MARKNGINPILKKVLAAAAIKQVVDRVQEARAPRRSFIRRNLGKLALLAAGGTALYVYKSGAADQFLGGGSKGYRESYPTGPGTSGFETLSSSATGPATGQDRSLEPSNA